MGLSARGDGGPGIDANVIVEVATTYTVTNLDDLVVADGTFTVTLPPLADVTKAVVIKSAVGGGTITVEGDGAETIDGELNQAVEVGNSLTVAPSSTEWIIVG